MPQRTLRCFLEIGLAAAYCWHPRLPGGCVDGIDKAVHECRWPASR